MNEDDDHYTSSEYEFLRKVAISLIEFRDLHATSARARNMDRVLADVKDFTLEDIDEF